jgi:hypothetical protein
MITFLTIAFLSTASAATFADAESARIAYSNCLVDFTSVNLDEKTSTSAFKKAATTACSVERNNLIAVIKKDEISYNSPESEAAQFATEEADNVLFAYTDGYAGYASSNTRPVKEQ